MKTVFIDTVAWLALVNKSDALHQRARAVCDDLIRSGVSGIVSDYVLVETANALSRPPLRSAAVKLISAIQTAEDIRVIAVTRELYMKAWKLYSDRADKTWGLTDCASFVIMQEYGIKDAFTADRHFEQAGFRILLKC